MRPADAGSRGVDSWNLVDLVKRATTPVNATGWVQELATARMDQHAAAVDELDVEGILTFAQDVLSGAAHLWTHASFTTTRLRRLQLFD